jgi:preprotein translocase subunit SecG
MLDKILFWVVLVWMVAMLVLAFLAVREVWREASQPEVDDDPASPTPPQEPKGPATVDPP